MSWGRARSGIIATPSSVSATAATLRKNLLLLGSAGGLAFRDAGEYGTGSSAKRPRSIFNMHDDLTIDDDFSDDPMLPEKKRRLTAEQVHQLEKSFEVENKLEPEKKTELAKKLGLQPRQVAVWYQNRRARWKTKQLEHDFDRLKTLYDTLVTDHGSLQADNQRLRSQVESLTKQLQGKNSTNQLPTTSSLPPPTSELSPSTVAPTPTVSSDEKGDDLFSTIIDNDSLRHLIPETCNSYFLEPNDMSFNDSCFYLFPSEDDDISDEGCGYFPPFLLDDADIVEGTDHCLRCYDYDDRPLLPAEEVDGSLMGLWF